MRVTGSVEKEPSSNRPGTKSKDNTPGIIMYDVNETKQTIPFNAKSVQGNPPKFGDKVSIILFILWIYS